MPAICAAETVLKERRRARNDLSAMKRLPQQFAPFVYGIIQALITTAVATAIATHQLTSLGVGFLHEWFSAWVLSFATMLPIVIFIAPVIQRCVLALIVRTAEDKLS
jgi:hypothetical protein